MPQLLLHIAATTCYNFNHILQNLSKSFKIPKIEPYYTCYRGTTCIYLVCVEYSGMFYVFSVFFVMVLHNVPFYRGISCIYLEYVEYSGMFYVLIFVMFYIIFHFMEA